MSAEIHVNGRPMLTQAMFDNQKIRDQFACAAMQGILASGKWLHSDQFMLARNAYEVADAMLKERAK